MNWVKFILIILGFTFLVSPFEVVLKIPEIGRLLITIGYVIFSLGMSIKNKE